MKRRTFITLLGGAAAWPLAARAQQATKSALRSRPIRRYKSWIRLASSRSALGRSLGCYGVALAFLVASFYALPPTLLARADEVIE